MDRTNARVLAGDRIVAAATTLADLERAEQQYLEALADDPGDAAVLVRLARTEHVRAFASGDLDAHRAARAWALQCLRADPRVDAAALETMPAAILEELDASRVPCLGQAALSWALWLEGWGAAGAAIDLGPAASLAAVAMARGESPEARQAQALLLALRPARLGGDLEAAKTAFARAIEAEPEDWSARVAFVRTVLVPLGDSATARGVLAPLLALEPAGEGVGRVEALAAREQARELAGALGADPAD